jgi:hypothetical protein
MTKFRLPGIGAPSRCARARHVGRACLAGGDQKLNDRVFAGARQPRNCADRTSLAKKMDDAGTFVSGQPVPRADVKWNITLCVKVSLTTAHGAIYRANPWT